MKESTQLNLAPAPPVCPQLGGEPVASVCAGAIKKLPVAETLNKMEMGEVVIFPIEQYSTIMSTRSRYRINRAREGWDVNIEPDKENFIVTVKRIG